MTTRIAGPLKIYLVGAVQELSSDKTSVTIKDDAGATVSISFGAEVQGHEFVPGKWYCLHRVKVSNCGRLTLWPTGGVEMLDD
eukprot:5392188-Amphidinium_carterae.1